MSHNIYCPEQGNCICGGDSSPALPTLEHSVSPLMAQVGTELFSEISHLCTDIVNYRSGTYDYLCLDTPDPSLITKIVCNTPSQDYRIIYHNGVYSAVFSHRWEGDDDE